MFRRADWLIGLGLVAARVALFAISMTLAPPPTEGAEAFAGTDATVTEVLTTEHQAEPWFSPVFEPGSGEVEAGLFALQAAIGAGVLGFALGSLRGRAAAAREQGPG